MSPESIAKHGTFLFTSESVSEGHPDKLADAISDAVLDAMLAQDKHSRVACETLVTTGLAVVAGEITSKAIVDIPAIVRKTICDIGYTHPDLGIDGNTCGVMITLDKQSPDIAMGVDSSDSKEQGAGDQGMMFGFACDETPNLMPLPIDLAHKVMQRLAELRKSGEMPYLRPDSKSQVTVEYHNGRPARIDTVVVSTQHDPDVTQKQLRNDVIELVINPLLPPELFSKKHITYHINPTGRFVIGGPHGDCGLTGRKIIVDTYGGRGRHGGGAFSGKDPSKVDRSAAYMARLAAKTVVKAGLAEQCEVQLAYAIGVADPVSVNVNTLGTGVTDEHRIALALQELFDFRPASLINALGLKAPIFRKTTNYGHFGREDQGFKWEETPKARALRKAAK